MITDRTRLAYVTAAAVGAGTAVFFIWWWWNHKQKYQLPTKWRKVGELSDLVIYPVKSLGPIRCTTMECTKLGLQIGWLCDRTLMVIDMNGHFVTARQMPKMVLVSPSVSGSIITLNAPGMMSLTIDLMNICKESFRTAVWGQAVPACDCGEEAARWLSRFLLQEDVGFRLVYYPLNKPVREIREKNRIFPLLENNDTGAYHDATSYNLINKRSIMDLCSRLEEPVTTSNFRPNFVVKGANAYEEHNWDWIKIGDIVFRNVKPCTRCIFTTIDPETGVKNPKVEPLKTLKSYRQIMDPEIRPYTGDAPVMGIHLALRGPNGTIRLGDPVYVDVSKEEETSIKSPP
ncbi:PREDICTED: mitochondrial amidoxime reducing component 2-like [Polistes dominula]|uniref:Mitochondrial amidoxime reducing component 2-like n=1 Tax=Polistes dominula TaxID=743375 RepID=A0ABM1J0G2_POLDO|nr:PREDICTED: mitochondrial amidoxime reducing component 2-like [Polistes dominula]